jgi:hypothetical protein
MIILQRAWDKCYGDVVGNRKAILERGWNPLNRGVLHHDHIRKKEELVVVLMTLMYQLVLLVNC